MAAAIEYVASLANGRASGATVLCDAALRYAAAVFHNRKRRSANKEKNEAPPWRKAP